MVFKILIPVFVVACSFAGTAQSRFFKDSVFSKSLNEERFLTIYLPDGYNNSDSLKYPVIYTTDGQLITDSYRKLLDSLVANKLVKPFILIGSHSNETPAGKGTELRNYDYLPGDPKIKSLYSNRFADHMQFFTNELVAYAETNYAVSKKPKERAFYGVSNGADFGVSLALAHPDQFKNFVLLSVFQGTKESFNWKKRDGLYFYLGYGLKEPSNVSKEIVRMEKYLVKNQVPQTVVTWNGGHERSFWEQTFVKSILRIFPME